MEREAPALVVFVAPQGESSARVHMLTEQDGLVRALAYGGASRAGRALWQPGNVVKARLMQRGEGAPTRVSGELLYGCAARILSMPLALAMMQSACVLADATLPEGEPCPAFFGATLKLLSFIGYSPDIAEQTGLPNYIEWELALLDVLGFGLDLSHCAATGQTHDLAYVSPRTGRAVSVEGAGAWKDRLLPLPAFLQDPTQAGNWSDWLDGLRLSGHFLARDAFGQRHLPLPAARQRLVTRVEKLVTGQNAP
ncbi:DNA repair protein RecO [Acetobacter sp. LMG 32666]|uniref:DNA repair protein RecO n=1 Tax=Acetobacter sp. LMG 32666 TaxID=2959295 RepID=UPI0030C7F9AD